MLCTSLPWLPSTHGGLSPATFFPAPRKTFPSRFTLSRGPYPWGVQHKVAFTPVVWGIWGSFLEEGMWAGKEGRQRPRGETEAQRGLTVSTRSPSQLTAGMFVQVQSLITPHVTVCARLPAVPLWG